MVQGTTGTKHICHTSCNAHLMIGRKMQQYVDDIFCLTDGTTDTEELVQKFDSAHPSLKFTTETEADNEIAFLDVFLHRQEDGSIQRRLFRKKTWTGQYVNFHSFVPLNIKRNLVQGLAARVRRICSPEAIEEELQQLRNTLRENGYPDRFILQNIGEHVEKPTVATAEKKEPQPVPVGISMSGHVQPSSLFWRPPVSIG
nr:unnamed protein product [Spirometra erinaceieuropaei]